MLEKMRLAFARVVSSQLRCPTKSVTGRFLARRFRRNSAFLEKGAVELLNIQPNDKVLEIGFGGGVGLLAAYSRVANGSGAIYGVERSHFMLQQAKSFCAIEIAEGKVHLNLSLVTLLPFPDEFFDRIFHCNSYFYWDNLLSAATELKRVLKPGGVVVATVSLDDLKRMEQDGYLQGCDFDPLDYMNSLDIVGFEGVRIEYVTGSEKTYQGIFATKPLQNAITDESFEADEDRFRRAMVELAASNLSKQTGRPVYKDYDPLEKKTKSSDDTDPMPVPK